VCEPADGTALLRASVAPTCWDSDGSKSSGAAGSASRFVVIGETPLARRVCATLNTSDGAVDHLEAPGDVELRAALAGEPGAVAILVRQDVVALRYALAVAHMSSSARLLVTVFDRTVGEQLRSLLPQATVTSIADLAAPSLAGPCLDSGWLAAKAIGNGVQVVRSRPDGPSLERAVIDLPSRWSRLVWRCCPRLRPHESGTLLMLAGFIGVLSILVIDWLWLVIGYGHPLTKAFFEAARVVATVGPASLDQRGWAYGLFAAIAMLVTIGLLAVFTAGIVERLLGPRLLTVFGPRSAPRSGHVIVVGLGQVGIRLCLELRKLRVPVVGVERDASAPNLRLARSLKIPTVVGHGGDRKQLQDLGLSRSRALAAVGSNDLDNLAVAMAAHGVSPATRVVMRAGEQEAIAETRSLLPLGVTRDVTRIAALFVVSSLRGNQIDGTVADDARIYTHTAAEFVAGVVGDRDSCTHSAELPR
jgi:voltage-gated potassium channel Kch